MTTDSPIAAVIDIGSNSIKILVARRDLEGRIIVLHAHTIEARISAGISHTAPQLTAAGMQRGLTAIRELLDQASAYAPSKIQLVATSAVRDASNGREFVETIHQETGHRIRILSGIEEANLIGRGLTCDPELADLHDFYLFDLGGGSLECLAFANRKIRQALSLRLGCVRLTEKFIPDSSIPIPNEILVAVAAHARDTLAAAAFLFDLNATATVIGTGGTVTTTRAIFAARYGVGFEQSSPLILVAEMKQLLVELSRLHLTQRCEFPGLPAARADVYPAGLATLIAVAEAGKFDAYLHSLHNLRYGLAAEILAG